VEWQDRAHFFSIASTLMRRILVDHARARGANKRGSGSETLELDETLLSAPGRSPEILALDDALNQLAALDQRQAKIVELRFIVGLTEEEIAEVLGLSVPTVKRDWRFAKAWLYKELAC
jgi:RNA polymerase sigma factor (TIGR02999 family)